MRISDWSSDVCSSDLETGACRGDADPAISQRLQCDPRALPSLAKQIGVGDENVVEVDVGGQLAVVADLAIGFAHLHASLVEIDDQLCHHRRSEEHTSELQSLMRISYAVFCLKKKKNN